MQSIKGLFHQHDKVGMCFDERPGTNNKFPSASELALFNTGMPGGDDEKGETGAIEKSG